MSSTSIDRKNQLEKLDTFIENTRKNISSIVTTLGWSIESISKDVENIVVCPFNETHHIPERTLEKHLEDCQWKAEGYAKEDLSLSDPTLPLGAASSIKFDEELQDTVIQNAKHKNPTMLLGAGGRLIPRTSDRLVADFTREERCAMYEYVIANTVEPDIGEDIADINKPRNAGDGSKSSYLELLAQERNLKRRRAKYRGVHTNKKSQVEILREVISQQMEMLGEYISEKNDYSTCCATNNATQNSKDTNRIDRTGEFYKSDKPASSDCLTGERSGWISNESNGRQYKSWDRKKSEDRGVYKQQLESRNNDRREKQHDDAWETSSRRSSHKSHRDKSMDRNRHGERHKRRSRERDKSRSSRDSRHDDRRSERDSNDSKRDSHHHHHRVKKRRRSRD